MPNAPGNYLLQFVHQSSGVFQGLVVSIVQAFGEDLIDNPVLALEPISSCPEILEREDLHQYDITGFAFSSCAARTMNLVRSAALSLGGILAAMAGKKWWRSNAIRQI